MNAVERLQAAIEKLSALRDTRGYVEHGEWLAEPVTGDTARYPIAGPREDLAPVTNDELMLILHRTIDAQLAILRVAAERGATAVSVGWTKEAAWGNERDALALADAILGGDS